MESLFKTPRTERQLNITDRVKAELKTGVISQFSTDPF